MHEPQSTPKTLLLAGCIFLGGLLFSSSAHSAERLDQLLPEMIGTLSRELQPADLRALSGVNRALRQQTRSNRFRPLFAKGLDFASQPFNDYRTVDVLLGQGLVDVSHLRIQFQSLEDYRALLADPRAKREIKALEIRDMRVCQDQQSLDLLKEWAHLKELSLILYPTCLAEATASTLERLSDLETLSLGLPHPSLLNASFEPLFHAIVRHPSLRKLIFDQWKNSIPIPPRLESLEWVAGLDCLPLIEALEKVPHLRELRVWMDHDGQCPSQLPTALKKLDHLVSFHLEGLYNGVRTQELLALQNARHLQTLSVPVHTPQDLDLLKNLALHNPDLHHLNIESGFPAQVDRDYSIALGNALSSLRSIKSFELSGTPLGQVLLRVPSFLSRLHPEARLKRLRIQCAPADEAILEEEHEGSSRLLEIEEFECILGVGTGLLKWLGPTLKRLSFNSWNFYGHTSALTSKELKAISDQFPKLEALQVFAKPEAVADAPLSEFYFPKLKSLDLILPELKGTFADSLTAPHASWNWSQAFPALDSLKIRAARSQLELKTLLFGLPRGLSYLSANTLPRAFTGPNEPLAFDNPLRAWEIQQGLLVFERAKNRWDEFYSL